MINLAPDLHQHVPLMRAWLKQADFQMPSRYINENSMAVTLLGLLVTQMKQTGYTLHFLTYNKELISDSNTADLFLKQTEYYPEKAIVIKFRYADFRMDMRDYPSQNNTIDAALSGSPNDKIRTFKVSENQFNLLIESSDTLSVMFRLISIIPALFKQLQIDDEVMAILESVAFWNGRKTSDLLRHYITPRIEHWQQDFKLMQLEDILDSAITYSETQRRDKIQRLQSNVRDLRESIRTNLRTIQDENYYLLGLKSVNFNIKELAQQIAQIKTIKVVQKENDITVRITATVPVSYDEEIAEDLITKGRDNVFKYNTALKEAFNRVFVTSEYTLYFTQPYLFNFVNGDVSSSSTSSQEHGLMGIPNPHLERFDCWGENDDAIAEAVLEHKDYIYAVTLSTVAVGVLNFTDATVLNYFIDRVTEKDHLYSETACLKNNKTDQFISWRELFELCAS